MEIVTSVLAPTGVITGFPGIAIPKVIGMAAIVLCLCGCGLIGGPRIKAGPVSVIAPKDAGKPATLATVEAGTTMDIPAGSVVKITKTEATVDNGVRKPETTVTEIVASEPTSIKHVEKRVDADTGTVDTSVAKHRIDVEERRWLLWAAIGCGIGGLVIRSLLPSWPSLSNGLLLGAVAAGASWKLADVPSWIWMAVIGVSALLVAGYKRAEWDHNGDGVPDVLQGHNDQTPKP